MNGIWKHRTIMRHIIKINPKYEGLRGLVERIVRKGMPADAEVIYRGRNILYAVEIGTQLEEHCESNKRGEERPSIRAIVKDFRKPNVVNAYVYTTLRASKAARSYENAMKMSELGFLTPEPIAYAEVRKGIKLVSSCYISRELVGATEMRHWEDHPNAGGLVRAFAAEIRRLHQKGVLHKDFSPGNILYKRGKGGEYNFYHVDLNRMKFGEKHHGKLMSMFKSINLKAEETRRLARYYAEESGLDIATTEQEALSELKKYLRKRDRKRRLKGIR